MTSLRSWRVELAFTSLVVGCWAGQTARRPDPVSFTRLPTYALEVDEPGIAVIRDSAAWSALGRYFGREYRSAGEGRIPIEAAVVPREWRHVTVVAARSAYPIPPRAPWWTRPSVDAALDSENSDVKRKSWRVLARDSTLPLKDLRRLTERAAAGVGPTLLRETAGVEDAFPITVRERVRP